MSKYFKNKFLTLNLQTFYGNYPTDFALIVYNKSVVYSIKKTKGDFL